VSPPILRWCQRLDVHESFEAERSGLRHVREVAQVACYAKCYLNVQAVPCEGSFVTEYDLLCFLLSTSLLSPLAELVSPNLSNGD
jgi:hypothetical protein